MSLLIDVIVIAAFAGCLIRGIKKGFIKSIIGIVIVIAAIIGSVQFSPALGNTLNDKFVHKSVVSAAKDSIPKVDTDTLINEMPTAFKKSLDRFRTDPEDVKELFENSDIEETEEQKRARIAEKMASPLSKAISRALAFLIIFVVLYLVLFIISIIVCAVVKLPLLRTADKLLGALLGGVSGILLAWGVSLAICALLPHLSVLYDGVVPETVIDNSIVVKFIGKFDPFNLIK
ncbi:MAG: CvpA family protein [Clostridia bacterium]|nr:CvpA family protein [Clostridia bacterium]